MKADDIQKGQWITISGSNQTVPDFVPPCCRPHDPGLEIAGAPLLVLAVNLPFLAVLFGDDVISVDSRKYQFTKVSRAYRNAVEPCINRHDHPAQSEPRRHEGDCPTCGDRMIERLQPDRVWSRHCRRCGTTVTRSSSTR